MWFEDLVGFPETNGDAVRSQLELQGELLHSRVNGSEHRCGRLELLSLAELRSRAAELDGTGSLTVREVVGDVQQLHALADSAGALFQAASQFNLLEMTSPSVTPEAGVGIYENDRTQGPACAVAAGAGTIYRNYLVPLGGQLGQTAARQLDALADLGAALGNHDSCLWDMRNGYALASADGLAAINAQLTASTADKLDELRTKLRIGVQWDVEVTLPGAGHLVTQVYGSALPVAYGEPPTAQWEPFARLVLEASYEATLWAAVLNREASGNRRVFLTLLGGGVFGNRIEWILDAIERALRLAGDCDLDVGIVSYGSSNPAVRGFAEGFG
ncbi:MAG: hypothetical protein ACI9EF_003094 [Pseudohongiellaceae bacterium]|jgi:hypothetical protein